MMRIHLLSLIAVICAITGCTTPGRPPDSSVEYKPVLTAEEPPANVTTLRVTQGAAPTGDDSAALDLSPSPELARAIERGEARPAGPVTDERYRRWYATADLRVRLEVRYGQQSHLRNLLKLAEESEDRFLERFGIGRVGPGESADLQLRMYQSVRERLQKQLIATDLEIASLRENIARISVAGDKSTVLGDRAMSKPLSECGFNAAQITKLDGLGIRNSREFALQFYLPEQHELLAKLLDVDLAAAQRLVRDAVKEVPEQELDELVREARRPHQFGVLPPDLDKKGK